MTGGDDKGYPEQVFRFRFQGGGKGVVHPQHFLLRQQSDALGGGDSRKTAQQHREQAEQPAGGGKRQLMHLKNQSDADGRRITRAAAGGLRALLVSLACLLPGGCAMERLTEKELWEIQSRLDEAEEAIARDRLTTPFAQSAYFQYLQILEKHPDNQEALLGLADLVEHYLAWALKAMMDGQFEQAGTWLTRATTVLPGHPNLKAAQRRLEQLRTARRERHPLTLAQLREKGARLEQRLLELGLRARRQGAEVIIRAPDDSDGRWVYQVMNGDGKAGRMSATFLRDASPSVTLIYRTAAASAAAILD